jgi:hypothetical protein
MTGNTTSRQSYQGIERRVNPRPFGTPSVSAVTALRATKALAAEASMEPTAFLLAVFDSKGCLSVSTCGIRAPQAQSILEALPIFTEDLRAIARGASGAIPAPALSQRKTAPRAS